MRFAVLMKGTLRGMGHEAPCELIATKTVLPEATQPVYSHCAIIEAPRELPDGDYEIEFAGEIAVTKRHGGSWMVGAILGHTYSEVASFYRTQRRHTGPDSEKHHTSRNRPKVGFNPSGDPQLG